MNKKKILSIDFDYYQNVTKKHLSIYPDGVDNDTSLSELVWGGIYGSVSKIAKLVKNIEIRKDELDLTKTIIANQRTDIPVKIANSHKHIYDFIYEYADVNEPLRLINVDMHHDMFNDNLKDNVLDCGNWVSFICNEFKTDLTWIANPVSSEMYGLKKVKNAEQIDRMIPLSVNAIKDMQFDMIFMCRSDTWTPPHLDPYFDELITVMRDHFDRIIAETSVLSPRKEYLKIAEENARIRNEFVKSSK